MDYRQVLQADIEKARRDMLEAKTRYETLVATLSKYEKTVQPSNGRGQVFEVPVVSTPEAVADPAKVDDQNKAAGVSWAIVNSGEKGIKVSNVISLLREQGIEISAPYVYNIVARLRKKGKAENRNGKVYPTALLIEEARVLP